ncbi:MAG: Zn-ribbon domain-containing OB-fold protein, partial [Acidimicrobiia bacterium]
MATPAPVRPGLFARDKTGAPYLIGGRCEVCGRDFFPAQSTCPYCGRAGAEEIRLPPTGRLWGWTAVLNAPPGYEG